MRRRSFVLVSVMVVTGSALYVAASLIFIARAEASSQRGSAEAAQARLLLWSGLQAIMVELDGQRQRILDAELPRLEREYVIYEEDGGGAGVVRLLPITPGGALLAPEAARLDLNSVDEEALVASGWVEADLAAAIVERRERHGGFQSVAELLEIDGITPGMFYGPLEDLAVIDQSTFEEGDLAERVETRLQGEEPRGLADLFTVYAFEPALQRSGRLRINLNRPWSEDMARRVADRFGTNAAEALKGLFDAGTTFEDEPKIFKVLRSFNLEPRDWPDIVDALTAEAGPYHFGRLDINTAPRDALAALPGLDVEQVSQIIQVRHRLSGEEKATVAWPAIHKIVKPEQYDKLAGRITTRSWCFRVRVAAGRVRADDPEGPLVRPLVAEAVIDLSAPRARVAYLRDLTLLQTTVMIALHAPEAAEAIEDAQEEADEPEKTTEAPEEDDGTDKPADAEPDDPGADVPDAPADATEPAADAGTDDGEPDDGEAADSGPEDAASAPAAGQGRRRIGRWRGG